MHVQPLLGELRVRVADAADKLALAKKSTLFLGWEYAKDPGALPLPLVYGGGTKHLDLNKVHKLETRLASLFTNLSQALNLIVGVAAVAPLLVTGELSISCCHLHITTMHHHTPTPPHYHHHHHHS